MEKYLTQGGHVGFVQLLGQGWGGKWGQQRGGGGRGQAGPGAVGGRGLGALLSPWPGAAWLGGGVRGGLVARVLLCYLVPVL